MEKDRLDELTNRFNELIRNHKTQHEEIMALKAELMALRKGETYDSSVKTVEKNISPAPKTQTPTPPKPRSQSVEKSSVFDRFKSADIDWESYIGGNLISKIGIAILVIGVGFFIKYAIDNELISPTLRVILGFISGISLVGVAYWLKEKYRQYSGVLLGGGVAILYFSTFAAYDFYELIPKEMAFGIMAAITAFTVVAAFIYDVESIGIYGLVGSYAVPVLLSDGTGDYRVLMAYMIVINTGVLVLAFLKNWKWLNFVAFALTWGIFVGWYDDSYNSGTDFGWTLGFATVFFLLFYAIRLAYKLLHEEKFNWKDIVYILINAFLYYAIGYEILDKGIRIEDNFLNTDKYLGVFTAGNAVLHFLASAWVYQKKLGDRNLFYLVAGLVLTFLTITIPVQLDGNWVTLLWIAEAALLFWIGRTKGVKFYQWLSLPLIVLAFFSLIHDWNKGYASYAYGSPVEQLPFINMYFLTSLSMLAGLIWIYHLYRNHPLTFEKKWQISIDGWMKYILPGLLMIVGYFAFHHEISEIFYRAFAASKIRVEENDQYNTFLLTFRSAWLLNYAFAFIAGLAALNFYRWKQVGLNMVILALLFIVSIGYLTEGLHDLTRLREAYQTASAADLYPRGMIYLLIRYITYAFVAIAFYFTHRTLSLGIKWEKLLPAFSIGLHLVILASLSAELLHVSHLIHGTENSYEFGEKIQRVGFSVLWGIYALFLMVLGFWKKRKLFRISAIVLFAITLVKVFLVDLANSSAGNKTVVFVALGVLLLIISFLYQRYKSIILGNDE